MQRFSKDNFLAEMVELLNYFVNVNVTSSYVLNEISIDLVAMVQSRIGKHATLLPTSRKKKINTKTMGNKVNYCFYSSQTKTLYISVFAWL